MNHNHYGVIVLGLLLLIVAYSADFRRWRKRRRIRRATHVRRCPKCRCKSPQYNRWTQP